MQILEYRRDNDWRLLGVYGHVLGMNSFILALHIDASWVKRSALTWIHLTGLLPASQVSASSAKLLFLLYLIYLSSGTNG